MKRGFWAESFNAWRSRLTALYTPCSESTKVSAGQIFCFLARHHLVRMLQQHVQDLQDCS
jgi:hypothetical protein